MEKKKRENLIQLIQLSSFDVEVMDLILPMIFHVPSFSSILLDLCVSFVWEKFILDTLKNKFNLENYVSGWDICPKYINYCSPNLMIRSARETRWQTSFPFGSDTLKAFDKPFLFWSLKTKSHNTSSRQDLSFFPQTTWP